MVQIAIAGLASAALSYASSALLTPKPKPQSPDVSILKSDVGTAIPKVYGAYRMTGNIIHARAQVTEEDGPGKSNLNVARATFAALLSEGVIADFGAIWLNNRMVANKYPSPDLPLSVQQSTLNQTNKFINKHVEFFPGTLTQGASGTLAALTGNSFTLRNRCYMVFKDLKLEKYGNSIPKVEVELIQFFGKPAIYLNYVLGDILQSKCGLSPSQFDVSDLGSIQVHGLQLKQNGQSVRDLIEELQIVYQFVCRESSGKLIFKRLPTSGSFTVFDIPKSYLATRDSRDPIDKMTLSRIQTNELPTKIEIDFINVGNSYRPGQRIAGRATVDNYDITETISTGVALPETHALELVTKLAKQHWNTRLEITNVMLPIEYNNQIFVGDLVRFPGIEETNSKVFMVTKKNLGANGILEIHCRLYDVESNNVIVPPVPPTLQPSLNFYGDPSTIAINTNLINDTDLEHGMYVVSKADGTNPPVSNGSLWYADGGASPTLANNWNGVHGIGTLTTAMPTSNPFTVQSHTITVNFSQGIPITESTTNFYNNSQVLFINGELIGFRTVTPLGGTSYQLGEVVRGLRGTEQQIAAHAANSQVLLLKANYPGISNSIDFGRNASLLNSNVNLFTTETSDSDNPNVLNAPYTNQRLLPYAPHALTVKRTLAGVVFTWQRRNRRNGEWVNGTETIPIIDNPTTFDFELDSPNGIFAETTTINNILVTNAELATLGLTNNATFSIRVWQVSATVGRGYQASQLVDVTSVES
jgi:hypothetical protein